ncbi:MAG: segregation/condensation protein A [Ardenticatenaceae bacterium]|nr:segregation/condensation protein A [Ardenticatenaceae bacterium]
MTTSNNIQLPTFSGPLDLLLNLIERQELDITAISLAKVASQFIEAVNELKARDEKIEQMIEFIVIGAQLALIKSRALLPKNPVIIEGEDEEDPAEALARRLRAYKQFKEAARWFKTRQENGLRTYLRLEPPPRPKKQSELDLSGLTTNSLHRSLIAILERAQRLEDSVSVAQVRPYTIEGQIDRLRRAVGQSNRFSFNSLLSKSVSRSELSVTLLAVLELIKRREVEAHQSYLFGPIDIVGVETDSN